MKVYLKKTMLFVITFVLAVCSLGIWDNSTANAASEKQTAKKKVTIYIAGDSIAAVHPDEFAPKMGWGSTLYQYFKGSEKVKITMPIYKENYQSARYELDHIVIENHANSGESLWSFIKKGYFKPILNDVKPGDFVFISFGHNDAGNKKGYATTPEKYETLLKQYVKKIQKKGATPVLITSIPRYNFRGNKMVKQFRQYHVAMRRVGKQLHVPYIGLGGEVNSYFSGLGAKKAKSMYLILEKGKFANYPAGITDKTHLSKQGAEQVSKLLVNLICQKEELKPIHKYLKVNTQRLSKEINKAASYNKAKYTKKSYANLTKALSNAKKVYYNKKATKKQVNAAVKNLNLRRRQLKRKK